MPPVPAVSHVGNPTSFVRGKKEGEVCNLPGCSNFPDWVGFLTALNKKLGYGPGRGMVDLVGSYYTLVLEMTYKDLADYERALKKVLGAKEWSSWYRQFMPLVESGHREIYTIPE